MKDKWNNIFSDSECISEETMYAYMENRLTSQERRIVEVHLASCELCSDALEGLSLVRDKDKIRKIVSDINEKITAKNIGIKPKSFWMNYRFSIAAALAFLVISIGAYFMITTNNEKTDQKIFAEKFKPFPNEVTKEKDERNVTAAPDGDKAPDAQGGKDIAMGGKDGKIEKNGQHLDNLEETEKNIITIPAQKGTSLERDRWINGTGNTGKYRDGDTTVLRSEITSRQLSDADVVSNGLTINQTIATDSISVVSGDQITVGKSAELQYKTVLKNNDFAVAGGSKNDKQDVSKKKGTPAKAYGGVEQNKDIVNAAPQDKKSSSKVQTTNLPAPNMAINGVMNNDNNNVNGNIVNAQGAKSNSGYFAVDNRSGLDTAMKKYEEKDYGGAITSYDGVLASDSNNYDALFYSGVSYLSLDKPDKAIVDLDKVLKMKDGKYYEAAQWYKALALIKQNDDKEAKKLLREIISNGGTYKSQANDTFNQLK